MSPTNTSRFLSARLIFGVPQLLNYRCLISCFLVDFLSLSTMQGENASSLDQCPHDSCDKRDLSGIISPNPRPVRYNSTYTLLPSQILIVLPTTPPKLGYCCLCKKLLEAILALVVRCTVLQWFCRLCPQDNHLLHWLAINVSAKPCSTPNCQILSPEPETS